MLGTCGPRFGEVAELRWRDLDLPNLRVRISRSVTLVDGVFEVGSPKNGKPRTVSLPAFVAELLAPGDLDALVFPDSAGGYMRGSNVRRRWWSRAVATAQLFPQKVTNATGEQTVVYDFKLHELRHTAASLAIQAGANIKALQNMLGHESAGLTLDRYGQPIRVGCGGRRSGHQSAVNAQLWAKRGHQRQFRASASGARYRLSCVFNLWSLGDSNP